jgi:hypothetical protein
LEILSVRFGRGCDTKLRMYLLRLVLRPGPNPVCDHWYPTKTCGRSNPAVRSSWDNVTSPVSGGRDSRERTRRLLALGRSGARVDGRANSGELLINVVRTDKPKALRGLNQKGTWPSAGVFPFPLPSLSSHRRTSRAYTIRDSSVERGKPVILPPG